MSSETWRAIKDAGAMDTGSWEFGELLSSLENSLRRVVGGERSMLLQSGSATSVLETSLRNMSRIGDEVLVLVNGQFGVRLCKIAEAVGRRVRRIDVAWGETIREEHLPHDLENISLAMMVHYETSTGVTNDISTISSRLTRDGVSLLVDAVSSIGEVDLSNITDDIDVLVAGSSKGLGSLPGTGVILKSSKYLPRKTVSTFFGDWRRMASDMSDSPRDVFLTPSVPTIAGMELNARLIVERGVEDHLNYRRSCHQALNSAVADAGLIAHRSDMCGPIALFRSFEGNALDLREKLREAGLVVGKSQGALSNTWVRFGWYGHHAGESAILRDNVRTVLECR